MRMRDLEPELIDKMTGKKIAKDNIIVFKTGNKIFVCLVRHCDGSGISFSDNGDVLEYTPKNF
jgi:hypothetical protein